MSPRRLPTQLLTLILLLLLAASAAAAPPSGKGKKRDSQPPVVSIASPGAGTTVSGTFSVAGSAADAVGVARVELRVDSGAFSTATGTNAWSLDVKATGLAAGEHTLTARAYDAADNAADASIRVVVEAAAPAPPPPLPAPPPPPQDTTPPAVTIDAPVAGATVLGSVTVSGTASDASGVARVELSVDGGPFAAASGTTAWTRALDADGLGNGSHTITARAFDLAGNSSAAAVTVSVTTDPGNGSATSTPEGVRIEIAPGVIGWTPEMVYDLLKPNALHLDRIGRSLTVKVLDQYASSASSGAGTVNGVYTSFSATIYLGGRDGSVFAARPDYVVAHEYGHVWSEYHRYLTQQGGWAPYLAARGVLNDSRLDSTYNWSRTEMIADDYRLLFGTAKAQSQSAYINADAPDPRLVAGLRDFLLNDWA